MRGEKAYFAPYEMRASIIKVVSYEQKNMKGLLVNPYFGREVYFENLTQLIFLIEGMLDDLNCPQKGMENRNFRKEETPPPKAVEAAPVPEVGPVVASFKLNILFRQNASWQGSIVWMEKAMESQFRSLLELIMLMDGVLSAL